MTDEKRICKVTGKEFIVTAWDRAFYERMDVPPPTLCPEERLRRRMSFANQRNLYHRTCSGSGKKIISQFTADTSFPVFDVEYFYSDQWDQFTTGRDFDFSRPFFEQFAELMAVAPRPNLQRAPEYDENSDYTNYAGKNKNCYLIFDSDKSRDCYYSYSINTCENVVDSFRAELCELCYECVDSINCYNSIYLQNCDNCYDSAFLKNCIGCKNCFGCVNLRNKEFWFFNERLTEEEYRRRLAEVGLSKRSALLGFRDRFQEYVKQFPHKYMEGVRNEDVTGNHLTECKSAYECFDCRKLWDCKYLVQAFDDCKNCMDCVQVGDGAELLYDTGYCGYISQNIRFCTHVLGQCSYTTYSYFLPHCSYCFGCLGLRHAKYCILNKQYSQEEYEELEPKIIQHMKDTGEWGEHFPIELSPFAYNETHAFEKLPLTKEEVLARGLRWKDDISQVSGTPTLTELPDTIDGVEDTIVKEIVQCAECQSNYRILKQELDFYRQMNLPLPNFCWNCRHAKRVGMRNEWNLFTRGCNGCGAKLVTTFSSEREEAVFCDNCYLERVE